MGRYISLPPGWNNNNLEAQFQTSKIVFQISTAEALHLLLFA